MGSPPARGRPGPCRAALGFLTLAPLVLLGMGAAPRMERIRPSADGSHFVREGSGGRFRVWGVNYDHDGSGRLLEDYWAEEWGTVEADFREMQALGVNLVRVHLQLGRFMTAMDRPDAANLERLRRLVGLAEGLGLYLDVTGLGCYHKKDVPGWYDRMGEADRWAVQARFWEAVAGACGGSPAVFCYDLMNEPIVAGGEAKGDWLPGEPLGGKHFVQRITTDARGRDDKTIAAAWIGRMVAAVREVDKATMITVGVIPWAQVFPGARPLFHDPAVGGPLDFVSVHFYPRKGKHAEDLAALKVYEVGKPLLVEEIFPLNAGFGETEALMTGSREWADGWVGFYWGTSPEEYERKGDLNSRVVGQWLGRWRALAPEFSGP